MKLSYIFVTLIFIFSISNASANVLKHNIMNNSQKISQELKDEIFLKESKRLLIKIMKSKKIPSILSRNFTKKYYRDHNYIPFWINSNGIKQISYDLINSMKNDAVLEPFSEKLFNLNKIDEQIKINKNTKDIKQLIILDIMLTSSYHQYMRYLSKGFINWEEFQNELKDRDEKKEIIANWKKYDVRKNIRKLLYKATKENDISLAINAVNYTFPKADELSKIIKEYEKISNNGGYIKVPSITKSLKKGNYYPQIKTLRERLIQSKDLDNNECIKRIEERNIEENVTKDILIENDCLDLYDENLFEAVKSFQKNHGLVEDGIVGRNTIEKLNIPINEKIKQIRVNLERMRWMPRSLGEKYLLINIPDYKLKMYNKGEVKLDMEVVVGEYNNPTPIFSHKMSFIVLNPYWRIPQSIVRKEIIPKLIEDPDYLVKSDIKVFENWSHKSMEFDISSVDWSMYLNNDLIGNSKQAPMRFIQTPSNNNPLGKMKFMFPNRYSVYLHDTPYKSLFKNKKRAYSHGCIRLSRPHELLKTIAEEDKKVNYEKAEEILSDTEKTDLDLSKKIPVHIVYLTTWIDENGKIQFRDDIYNYDKIQENILYNKSL